MAQILFVDFFILARVILCNIAFNNCWYLDVLVGKIILQFH